MAETSIVAKLKLDKYKKPAVLDMPEGADYMADLAGYDTELKDTKYDLIFAFVLDMASMKKLVDMLIGRDMLLEGGYVYLAYPKKGNKVYPTFIHRDELFAGLSADETTGYIEGSGLKFSRMVGLDDVFTIVGLKREARGKGKPQSSAAPKPSQRVDDYVALIPEVENDLQDTPDLLAFYQSLPEGYRKDWARYVYSAKQEDTRAKRREEMKMILGQGYKSRELYRKAKE